MNYSQEKKMEMMQLLDAIIQLFGYRYILHYRLLTAGNLITCITLQLSKGLIIH